MLKEDASRDMDDATTAEYIDGGEVERGGGGVGTQKNPRQVGGVGGPGFAVSEPKEKRKKIPNNNISWRSTMQT